MFLRLLFVLCAFFSTTAFADVVVTVDGQQHHTGAVKPDNWNRGVTFFNPIVQLGTLPASFDWEAQGVKTPVRDQGSCGSCWAFGSTQTLENTVKRVLGKDIDFSEQQIVSCDNNSSGCSGGWFAGDYMVKNGLGTEAQFPYTASNAKCKANLTPAAQPIRWAYAGAANRVPTAEEVKTAIMQFGAVSVTVAASSGWSVDANGVLKGCGNGSINHMVTVTGWDDSINGGAWKMKNSWGTSWGQAGYAWVKYGCYKIASEAAYVVLQDGPVPPPVVPKISLPVDMMVRYNLPLAIAIKPEPNVTYEWYKKGTTVKLADGPILYLSTVTETAIYVLRASNASGRAEDSVQVNVLL